MHQRKNVAYQAEWCTHYNPAGAMACAVIIQRKNVQLQWFKLWTDANKCSKISRIVQYIQATCINYPCLQ
jgi:hypothetical protein